MLLLILKILLIHFLGDEEKRIKFFKENLKQE